MRFTSFIALLSIAVVSFLYSQKIVVYKASISQKIVHKQVYQLRVKCEREAEILNNTMYHQDFIGECMESGHWYKTEVDTNQIWMECVAVNNYTLYDQCMVDNFVERPKMTPTNNCYFEKIGALKIDRNIDVYRLVAIDERYLNKTKASLYPKYRNCIDINWEPITQSDAIDLYKCFCVDIKFYDRVTETFNVTSIDMECRSRCSAEAYEELRDSKVNEKNEPYIKCLLERLYILDNGCYYVERDIEYVGERRTAIAKENLRSCFRNSVGEFEMNFNKFFRCGFDIKFFI